MRVHCMTALTATQVWSRSALDNLVKVYRHYVWNPIWPDIHKFWPYIWFSVMFFRWWITGRHSRSAESPTCERFRYPNLTTGQIQFCPDTCNKWPENVCLLDVIVSTGTDIPSVSPGIDYIVDSIIFGPGSHLVLFRAFTSHCTGFRC